MKCTVKDIVGFISTVKAAEDQGADMVDSALANVFDCLVDVANRIERLEAQPDPTSMRITLASLKSAERKGMIEALRWALESDYVDRLAAITRLENGGDL